MEILLAIAGLTGLALLLQSKALPSLEDYEKAKEKLATTPTDPAANTIAGKYLAFVVGDYKEGAKHLVLSDDKTLATLAEHDSNPTYFDSGVKKVGLADEWVTAAKKYPKISNVFYDRAAQWYAAAWPDVDGIWRDRVRERGLKMSAARPNGAKRKSPLVDWPIHPGIAGAAWALDNTVSRSGSYSAKLIPADEKVNGSASAIRSTLGPVTGNTVDASVYVLSNGTENGADRVHLEFFDANAKQMLFNTISAFIPLDVPFWQRINLKGNVPKGAARFQIGASIYSKQGNFWIDDASVKFDGKEALKNGSFEDK